MSNERGAGRKPVLKEADLLEIRRRCKAGNTIAELAKEYHVSRQTLSKYLNAEQAVDYDHEAVRQAYRTVAQWRRLNRCFEGENVTDYTIRMDFMDGEKCCTCMLINLKSRRILVKNTTDVLLHRAFGIKQSPTFEDFEAFLEERCFPRTRAHLRLVLQDVGVDSYDPLAIVEKTRGRMAEDDQWLRIRYFVPLPAV